ncbi:pesticin immunity protein [Sphingobium sp. MP9-4]|uniref:pesticin immunity protein n=1 Tax=Sphingobium sp. MP9-4 TaxID=1761936 RepID=UPI0010CA96F1|nr:pesticin immunity protein [Sphingobium sp. MP9-4]
MKRLNALVIVTMLASSTVVVGGVTNKAVTSIVASLDLTSFPNSTGPQRASGKKTFSDYGFNVIEKDMRSAHLEKGSHEWEMSFDVLSRADHQMTICFRDRARNGGSYNTVSALSLSKSSEGMWIARQLKGGVPDCRNDPED